MLDTIAICCKKTAVKQKNFSLYVVIVRLFA
jgi:hypothetical protein